MFKIFKELSTIIVIIFGAESAKWLHNGRCLVMVVLLVIYGDMSEECPNHHPTNRLIVRSMADNNKLKTLTVVWKEDHILQDMQLGVDRNKFEQGCKFDKI